LRQKKPPNKKSWSQTKHCPGDLMNILTVLVRVKRKMMKKGERRERRERKKSLKKEMKKEMKTQPGGT